MTLCVCVCMYVCVTKCINLGSLVCRYYLLAVTSIWAQTAETYQIQPRASRDPLTNITVLLSSIGCWMLTYSEHYCNVSQMLPTKPQNAVTWDRPLLTCWTWGVWCTWRYSTCMKRNTHIERDHTRERKRPDAHTLSCFHLELYLTWIVTNMFYLVFTAYWHPNHKRDM